MLRSRGDNFELIVIGGGHAGCEAALAAARLGVRTLLISPNLDSVGHMPCNCSIGGPGKAHLVSEIDALGGEMGRNTDRCFTHIRVLNAAKGPAVKALRAQADKALYRQTLKQALETQPGLSLWQDMVSGVQAVGDQITGVQTAAGLNLPCRAVVVTAGTFLNGLIHLGEVSYAAGRAGEFAATSLTASLEALGLTFQRFKTGTVPRILKSSLNFSELTVQPSDQRPLRFHHSPVRRPERQLLACWISRTTPETHGLLRENLHLSALVAGRITGTGPRYCPSIEAKLLRFPDRDSHLVFLEQEGWDTEEIYVQGLSNSLPPAVQLEMLRSVPGLARAEMIRPGYAIEYDCVDARQLDRALAFPPVTGLYLAGQVNGTSGYEEAAAQGLVAGLNAVRFLRDLPPVQISRAQGYLGVLIDDLVTKGTDEPYRMLTARAEHRLSLGQNSALRRLGPLGRETGLLPAEVMERVEGEERLVAAELERLRALRTLPGTDSLPYAQLLSAYPPPQGFSARLQAEVEIRLRYEPYWEQAAQDLRRALHLSRVRIPCDFPYAETPLRREARERLAQARPDNLEQAAALPGVTPADIATLEAWLRRRSQHVSRETYAGDSEEEA